MQLLQSRRVEVSTSDDTIIGNSSQQQLITDSSISKFRIFKWNDNDSIEYYVPKNWTFPNRQCSTKMLWDLWWFGNVDIGVRPYRLLRRQYDIGVGPPQNRYSHASVLITVLKKIMLEQQFVVEKFQFEVMNIQTSDSTFPLGYNYLIRYIYNNNVPPKHDQLSYSTI